MKPLPIRATTLVLAIVAFLAPIIGGQVHDTVTAFQGPVVLEWLGSPSVPYMTRLLLSLPVLGVGLWLLWKHKVIQLPPVVAAGCLLALGFLMAACSLSAGFTAEGLASSLSWAVYGISTFVVVATIGRKEGPATLVMAMAAGCAVVGLRAISEYASVVRVDPGHRVFAGWNNPNAVATVFVVGIPLLLALAAKGPRLLSLVSSVLAGLCLTSLWFTGSRGALLALFLGLACFYVFLALRKSAMKAVPWTLGAVALAGLLVFVLHHPAQPATSSTSVLLPVAQLESPQAAPAEAAPRQFAVDTTFQQSITFRLLLWKSTLKLIQAHPFGLGAGNFRFLSSQPGLVEQTVFSHQTWLEIAAEASPLGLLAALGALGTWFMAVSRREAGLPFELTCLRAGVLAAVVGAAANGFIESNLYVFGAGLMFFMLIGAGFQLAPIGSAPETTSTRLRFAAGLVLLVICLGLAVTAATEFVDANFKTESAGADRSTVQSLVAGLDSAPSDADGLYMHALYATSPEERLDLLRRAVELSPSTRMLRADSRALVAAGKVEEGRASLVRALELDPNNLRTLAALLKLDEDRKDDQQALADAKRLVAVEETSVFKTRALPEVIPTETYVARLYLAEHSQDAKEKVALLVPAVQGFRSFAGITYPRVKMFADPQNGGGDFAGVSMEEAEATVAAGRKACDELKEAAQGCGDAGALSISTSGSAELAAL